MISSPFHHQPTIFKALILLTLLQLSLQINHTNPTSQHPNPMPLNPQKKLQRLPHIFSQVLELPVHSHADVFIEDKPDCLRFTANVEDNVFSGWVKAYAVKIHPGVTKVVVRGGIEINDGEITDTDLLLDKLEIDAWRFRLPAITRPELATAVSSGRKLVVTVPKAGRSGYGGGKKEFWDSGRGRLVSVQ